MNWCPVKQKATKAMGGSWTHAQLAERAGAVRSDVTREINCTGLPGCRARHTPGLQDAISKALGMSTGKLFGPHAWFRFAGKGLCKARRTQRKAEAHSQRRSA